MAHLGVLSPLLVVPDLLLMKRVLEIGFTLVHAQHDPDHAHGAY